MSDYEDAISALLPKGWIYVDECEIVCPHGHSIELDGECPQGCQSPVFDLI